MFSFIYDFPLNDEKEPLAAENNKIPYGKGLDQPIQWEEIGVYSTSNFKSTLKSQATQNREVFIPDKDGVVAFTNDIYFDSDSELLFTGDNDTNGYTPPNYTYDPHNPTTGISLGKKGIRFLTSNPNSSVNLNVHSEGQISFKPNLAGSFRIGVNQFNRWIGYWGSVHGAPWYYFEESPVYTIFSWWKGHDPWNPAPFTTRLGRIEFRLGDYTVDHANKVCCTMESTGVLPAIGFLGAEPEIRQPGGDLYAGDVYSLNEKDMLNKIYSAFRLFGFIE